MKLKSLLLAVSVLLAAFAFSSCSGDKSADAGELLATVPSDASIVAVANTGALLEKAGCKVDAEKITPGKEVSEMIESIIDPQTKLVVKAIFDGQSGIDPSITGFFQVGYYNYLTGFLADPSKFKAGVEKQMNTKFSDEDGIDVAANVAVSGNRYWINLANSSIDPKEVKHFTSLDKTQSFLSNQYAEQLSKIEKDIEGWGNIHGVLKTANLSFQDQATIQVAIQTIFEDPASIGFSMEFKDNKLTAEANILNTKGNYAKYRLPDQKLDMKTIETIGGKAEGLVAIAIPSKLVKTLADETSSKSPSVLGVYLQQLSGLDGTAAVAMGKDGSLRGVVTTNGKDIAGLSQILGADITITKEGNLLKLAKGTLSGPSEVSELAAPMKNAIAGVASTTEPGKLFKAQGLTAMSLQKSGDGLKILVEVSSSDKNEKAILTLLKDIQ